ncbi:MAG TPA: helix-turn-helix domain-containing protein [Baekduia sp.]|nr:helix-turn-helix domain-containing protein [Baekduia sp.]
MLGNAGVAWIEADELEGLPAEAQVFHRRARIVDAAVREIAERGYGQVAEETIARRAGVTPRAFFELFAGKEEALIWAYDVAAAYVVPQVLRALQAESDWQRGATAALSTYLTILDCDRAWAIACLRDLPAAGERARAARDAVRAPVLDALAAPESLPAAGGVGIEMILTAIDAIAVDGLRHSPGQSLVERRRELAALALAPFTDEPPPTDVAATTLRPPLLAAEVEALLDAGGGGEDLELLVREAVDLRDGPTLWQVIAVLQRRSGGDPTLRRAEQLALDALEDAWFFGLPLADRGEDVPAQ